MDGPPTDIKSRNDVLKMGIAKYNEECRSIVMRYSKEWEKTVTRLGRWIDFANDYKTLDVTFMESVWWVFKQLFDKGLVYRGFKVSWWLTVALHTYPIPHTLAHIVHARCSVAGRMRSNHHATLACAFVYKRLAHHPIPQQPPTVLFFFSQVMPYSTGCSTALSNFEAGLNYKDVSDPAVMVRVPWTHCEARDAGAVDVQQHT